MAKQQLDRAQIGVGLEQMSREAMPHGVRVQRIVHTAALHRPATGMPDDFFGDRSFGGVMCAAGEKPDRGFTPKSAIVLSELLQQARTEDDVPVLAAFAFL